MDKVYVVMVDDRHVDPEPTVFLWPDDAITYAQKIATDYARNPDDIEVEPIEGWLWHARYSGEGDSVWVLEKPVIGAAGA